MCRYYCLKRAGKTHPTLIILSIGAKRKSAFVGSLLIKNLASDKKLPIYVSSRILKTDEIVIVAEADHPSCIRFQHGEEAFQHVPDALPQVTVEIIE